MLKKGSPQSCGFPHTTAFKGRAVDLSPKLPPLHWTQPKYGGCLATKKRIVMARGVSHGTEHEPWRMEQHGVLLQHGQE